MADELTKPLTALAKAAYEQGYKHGVESQGAELVAVRAERDALRAAIHGCHCPAPYDECPHDEPLLMQVDKLRVACQVAQADRVAAVVRAETAEAELLSAELQAMDPGLHEALLASIRAARDAAVARAETAEAELKRARIMAERDGDLLRLFRGDRDTARKECIRWQDDYEGELHARVDAEVERDRYKDALAAYRTFVEAHGPLTDFATNAEMVDFEIACERAPAGTGPTGVDDG